MNYKIELGEYGTDENWTVIVPKCKSEGFLRFLRPKITFLSIAFTALKKLPPFNPDQDLFIIPNNHSRETINEWISRFEKSQETQEEEG